MVEFGAMLNLLSVNNETPEDLARLNNSIDCLKLISKREQKKTPDIYILFNIR